MAKASKRKVSEEVPATEVDLMSEMEAEFKKAFKDDSAVSFENFKKDSIDIWYPTGLYNLDVAIGGGLAGGTMSEWWGENGSGKSTLLYQAIAKTQEMYPDKICVLADPENSADKARKHMALLGVDPSRLFYIANQSKGKPRYAEDIFERLEFALRNPKWHGKIAIIGVDSIGALVSRAEGENADKWDKNARVGGITQVLSMFQRTIIDSGLLEASGAHLFCLNQVRANIGDQWNPWKTPGGEKWKHSAGLRVHVSKLQGADYKNPSFDSKKPSPLISEFIGQKIKCKVVKNKVGGCESGRQAFANFLYNYGIDTLYDVITMAKWVGVLQGSSWMTLVDPETGESIAKYQGEDQWRNALSENDELWEQINILVAKYLHKTEEEEFPTNESEETEQLPQD